MKENEPRLTTSAEEIDLLELLAKGIRIINKYILFILIAFFLGTALGLVYYQIAPNVYESRMFISSDILTESYSKSIIDNLVKLMREENTSALAKKLNLSEEQASQLISIEVGSALERSDGTLESGKAYFYLIVKSRDNTGWQRLQDELINCLQSNEFVKTRVDQQRLEYQQLIDKIDLELIDLEKLKKKILEDDMKKSTKENFYMFDPTTINSKIVEMNKERGVLQTSLKIVNSVQLVEGFTAFKKPASPKLSMSIVAGSTFGLFFAGIYIAIQLVLSALRFSDSKIEKTDH